MKRNSNSWWRDELGIKTKADVENKIRAIVTHGELGAIAVDDAAWLDKILVHHYQYAAKVGTGVASMEVRVNPSWNGPTKGIWFLRYDGTEVDISWVVALMPGGRPSAKVDASAAARFEIYPQIHAHHADGACGACGLCSLSMSRNSSLHVDHVVPFEILFSDFLWAADLDYDAIALEDLGVDTQFADRALAEQWRAFHAAKAQLRLVHARCNLTRARA